MRQLLGALALTSIVVAGCGGGGSSSNGIGSLAGVVFDQTGASVANARVWTGSRSTTSSLTGSYLISNVPGNDVVVEAEVYLNGQRYYGRNTSTVYPSERTKNVNLAVYPANQLASIHGEVRDSSGALLKGVRVFMRQNTSGTVLSSAVAVSDDSGQYAITGLGANVDYALQANGLGYGSDTAIVTLNSGENRTFNLFIPNGSSVTPAAPTGVSATAWTTPKNATRDPRWSSQFAAIKAAVGGRTPNRALTRDTGLGGAIEVDLFWNPVISTSTLGYGVYRAVNGGALVNVDYYRDPIGEFYADQDSSLIPGATYTYALSTLSTSYSAGSGESARSAAVSVSPLGDVVPTAPVVSSGGVVFGWSPATGATSYEVVVYATNPTIGVNPVYVSSWNPGASFAYSGSELTRGSLYYAAIVGQNANGDKTVSPVFTFTR